MTLPEKNILNWTTLLIIASFGIGVSLWAYFQILALPIVIDLETTGTIYQDNWSAYRNEKEGFEIQYPADILQLSKAQNTLSHTLENFHKYSLKDGSDLGLAKDISLTFKKDAQQCDEMAQGILKDSGQVFKLKNIQGLKYEMGAEGEGIIFYCAQNQNKKNIFLIERNFLLETYSTELPKQKDFLNNTQQENLTNQILTTFNFIK